jgi:hypothetical protein
MTFHPCLSQNVKIYDSCFNMKTATAQSVKTQLRKYVQSAHFVVSCKTCHGGLYRIKCLQKAGIYTVTLPCSETYVLPDVGF